MDKLSFPINNLLDLQLINPFSGYFPLHLQTHLQCLWKGVTLHSSLPIFLHWHSPKFIRLLFRKLASHMSLCDGLSHHNNLWHYSSFLYTVYIQPTQHYIFITANPFFSPALHLYLLYLMFGLTWLKWQIYETT